MIRNDGMHHDGSPLYAGTDRPDIGDVVPVWLRVPRDAAPDGVWVRSTPDAEPHYDRAVIDREDEHVVWYRADVNIHNPVTRYRWLLGGPSGAYAWFSGTGRHGNDVPDAHDFTLSAHPPPPEWAADAQIYQIFPDRFARSAAADDRPVPSWAIPAGWDDTVQYEMPLVPRQFYGGDLDGVVEHLDHIQGLGFDTVYLTPYFPAASNHRYDASSFDRVDPLLGGDAALARLSSALHERNMRIIGDLTTNHSGSTHEWFQNAVADDSAPERSFYYFNPDGSYVGWLDVATLPKFRFGPELHSRLLEGADSVVGRWLREPFDLDGWRIDVANMTGRRTRDDTNLDIARALRRTMAEVKPDTLLVAEHCHDASGDLSGEGWHGAMNYAGFLRPLWAWLRAEDYRAGFLGLPVNVPRLGGTSTYETIREFQAVTPWRSLTSSWSLLCSHDTPRIRTVVGDRDVVAVAAGLLFTFPGAPMVFMGDELGGEGVIGEDARRPMPWHRPETWDRVTLERYRRLATLRAASPALRRGGMRWLAADDEFLLYIRETPDEALLCVASRGSSRPIAVPRSLLGLAETGRATAVYGGADELRVRADGTVSVPLEGPTFQVWRLR